MRIKELKALLNNCNDDMEVIYRDSNGRLGDIHSIAKYEDADDDIHLVILNEIS